MISFEDFLMRPSKIVDPFNRLVSKIDPFIMMVEFCQVIGPKPLEIVSSRMDNKVNGVDINEMAIWLMSSDTVPGTIIVLENNQTGIYAIAYYFNLYDMRARAFQRNLCVAYLSSERPNKEMLGKFSDEMKNMISPILICNRKLFIRHVTDIVKFSDSIDETNLQQYYTLNGDVQKVTDVGRFNVVFEQSRLLKSKFLTNTKFRDLVFEDTICCGHNLENMPEVEDIICSFRVPSKPLNPVETLIPCAYSGISRQLRNVLKICRRQSRPTNMIGALYSAETPISIIERSDGTLAHFNKLDKTNEKEEQTLRAITSHLGDVLYPLLCGDDMVVCGNEQRKTTVEDILEKLNIVTPRASARIEKTKLETDPSRIDSGIGGLQCTRSETGKLARWRHVLDMNRCVLKTFTYDGVLLSALNKKRKFPTDRSLILFIVSYLTNICSLAYLSRFLLRFPDGFEKLEPKLLADDEKIIVNLLNTRIYIKLENVEIHTKLRKLMEVPFFISSDDIIFQRKAKRNLKEGCDINIRMPFRIVEGIKRLF